MKRIKLLASLFIMLAVGMFSSIMCHADMVDDICDEFGYNYRWTVEVELDDTYKGTGLYEISDNGRLQISYIVPKEKMYVKDVRLGVEDCLVFSGKIEFVCGGG